MKDAKQIMIDKIINSIRDLGTNIKADPYLSLGDKIIQIDIILDTVRFLSDYDENMQILNESRTSKRKKDICRDG